MINYLGYFLVVIFIVSTIAYSYVTIIGRSYEQAENKYDRIKALWAGIHTKASIEKYIVPKYKTTAVLLFQVRNLSLASIILINRV